MEKPIFEEVILVLEKHSQDVKDNGQYGNSKLILAYVEMVKVMAWQSSQQEINNVQTTGLIEEISALRVVTEEANRNSEKLEVANYRLQMIMVTLTVIGTLVITFPILKAIFEWVAAVSIGNSIGVLLASKDSINALAGLFAGLIATLSFWQAQKVTLKQ